MEYLAHSARRNRGIPEQTYVGHVTHVVRDAMAHAKRAAEHSAKYGALLQAAVRQAAEFHDLGKLDDANQAIFNSGGTKQGLPVNHVDAGVAHLLDGSPNSVRVVAALATFAHHIGLPAIAAENEKGAGKVFRDADSTHNATSLREWTDSRLSEYRDRHRSCMRNLPTATPNELRIAAHPMLLRFALSCLVDADHTDTARHYRDPAVDWPTPSLAAAERLELLDAYVSQLNCGKDDERTRLRSLVYLQCRNADCSAGLVACDSPVGTGKTTAIMAHMLRAATTKALRRVFVVLPFTNIIDQSVNVYRKALIRDSESPGDVVAAHHHRAEFDDVAARQYSFLWHAPVVVTTAVQFFETLAARSPTALRKLHQVPGSAIFIDEAHAALPAHLWPQAWLWLQDLERNWNCHLVFGSGSLQNFWENEEFVEPKVTLPQLVSFDVRKSSAHHEARRVTPRTHPESLDLEHLAKFVEKLDGPRLLIVNTVQSAAAIARHFAERFGGERVEHLSTALTPRDRKVTLDLVRLRLQMPHHCDWTLVATSCVESGVDISFRTGIRERSSLTSFLQTAGRVNRSNEYERSDVWDIQLRHDHLLRPHPAFEASARILGELFSEGQVSPDFCTEALRREISQQGMTKKKQDILIAERNADFPSVEEFFRVIASNTLTAVVDQELIRQLETGETVGRNELQAGSVQIWQERAQDWGVEDIAFIPGLKKWCQPYDRFLGYMAGVLPLVDAGQTGMFCA